MTTRPDEGSRAPRRARVLVIDDEPALASTLAFLLRDRHDVEIATSGREGLERLLSGAHFDLVLCDLMRPSVSGMDIFERVRAERPGEERRIVFMTGGTFTSRASAFVATIQNPVVEKPFTVELIESLLDKLPTA